MGGSGTRLPYFGLRAHWCQLVCLSDLWEFMVLAAVLGVGGSSGIGGSLFVGGSLICWREFSVAVGRRWFFNVDGWVRRVSVTRGSRMIQDQRLYFLQRNGYFLATATFRQRLLSGNGYFWRR